MNAAEYAQFLSDLFERIAYESVGKDWFWKEEQEITPGKYVLASHVAPMPQCPFSSVFPPLCARAYHCRAVMCRMNRLTSLKS